MSREATMLQGRREVRLLRLSLVRPAAPNTYGGSASGLLPRHADCDPKWIASQKLHRAPCWPCKASRLTWASEAAAWSRQFAGRQVRCRLNRRAAVASSLQATRDKNPRLPYGRPIKTSEVGSFPHSASESGRRTEASRNRSFYRAFQNARLLAASLVAFVPGVPQLGCAARPYGAGLAQGGGLRDAGATRRGTGTRSRAHNCCAPS